MKLTKICTIVILCLTLFTISASAQKIMISGTVKDKTGEPVIGASVVEKGTANGVMTDIDGKYTINVNGTKTIRFSSVGMKTVEKSVTEKSIINGVRNMRVFSCL